MPVAPPPTAYREKVAAGWLGKCLGGAIGMPYEGVPALRRPLTAADVVVPATPNDDLELQLIWLVALREHGLGLDCETMGRYWRRFIPRGCDEYSIALRNLRRGIAPPESGYFENYFADGMGAAIRSEIWAMVFAGRPGLAAQFAIADATVDHWGDGVWAEILMARLEATAFELDDLTALYRRALAWLPAESRLRQAVTTALELHGAGVPPARAFQQLKARWSHPNFTDCAMNCAYLAAALLYGDHDFVKTILYAVNFGRDTDCIAASAGAVLGIADGLEAIPAAWRKQVPDELALSDFVATMPGIPRTLSELTHETIRLHERWRDLPEPPGAGAYEPFRPHRERPRPHRWLMLDESEGDMSALAAELRRTGRCPERFRERVVSTGELVFSLAPAARAANTVHLFSFFEASGLPETVVISATADVGMTLYLDDVRLVNHHSRLPLLPSFHRAEGGAAFAYPLQAGRRYLVHWVLYYCHEADLAALMFGDLDNNYLDGITLTI